MTLEAQQSALLALLDQRGRETMAAAGSGPRQATAGGSAHIVTRRTRDGKQRYRVRYRRGGRGFRLEYGGSFRRRADAETRRRLIDGWLAAGRDPRIELAKLREPQPARRLIDVGRDWLGSRYDLAERTTRVYAEQLKAIEATPLGKADPVTITPSDVQRQVGAWVEAGLAAKTVRGYVSIVRQALDHADVEPNPARHRSVRLPSPEDKVIEPPSADELLKLLDNVPRKYRLALVTIEQCGTRITEAVALEWRDVDVDGSRFRIRPETQKGRRGRRRGRWVQVSDWLMDIITETCPWDDRVPERLVFQGISDHHLRKVMTTACKSAGIAHYSPHDLRHRRISLWHGQGVPAAELAARAGHSKASMSLDVYSHVMSPVEVPRKDLEMRARESLGDALEQV